MEIRGAFLRAWQEGLLHDVLADGEPQPEVHVLGQQVAFAAKLAAVRNDCRFRGPGRPADGVVLRLV